MSTKTEQTRKLAKRADALRGNLLKRKQQERSRTPEKEKLGKEKKEKK
jgi:hypothetical protein